MDSNQENSREYPPRFSDEENRQIDMLTEAFRRLIAGNVTTDFTDTPATDPATEPIVVLDTSDNGLHPFDRVYSARRWNVLSCILAIWKRICMGIVLVLGLWVLAGVVPGSLYGVQPWSETSLNIGLISVVATLIITATIFLLELQSIMRWRNRMIEVTEAEVVITQKRSFFGRLDDERISLRRSRIDNVKVSRKWYFSLFRINAYTVTFDAPGEEDHDFHNLTYIKDGEFLKELLNYRTA